MSKIERVTSKEFRIAYPTFFKAEKKNKFNAQRTVVNVNKNETTYMSAGEGNYAKGLELQQRAGLINSFEQQVKEELYSNGVHICNYYVDFLVYHLDGRKEFIEYKGYLTEVSRIKWAMLKAKYKDEISRGEVTCSMVKHKEKYNYFKSVKK